MGVDNSFHFLNYTIPRKIRELQCISCRILRAYHYTIPRKIRELQYSALGPLPKTHYTIPRKIRELQSWLYRY